MARKLPVSVSDHLIHVRDSDTTERVLLPITRYKNVLSAPRVVSNPYTVQGAPFLLYKTDEETLSTAQIRKLVGDILEKGGKQLWLIQESHIQKKKLMQK